jgi:hypothetical protein
MRNFSHAITVPFRETGSAAETTQHETSRINFERCQEAFYALMEDQKPEFTIKNCTVFLFKD